MDLMGIGSIAQAGASVLNAGINAYAANRAQQKQLAWEKERATHAHQWEVEDLKNAGLNPILSAGGQGATTGGISAPVPDLSGIGDAISSAFQVYNDTKRVKNETDTTAADVDRTNAERINIMQDTINKMREEGLIDAKKQREYTETLLKNGEVQLVQNQLRREKETLDLEIQALKEQLTTAKTIAEKQKIQAEIDKKTAWAEKILGMTGSVIGMGTEVTKAKAAMTSAKKTVSHVTNNFIGEY